MALCHPKRIQTDHICFFLLLLLSGQLQAEIVIFNSPNTSTNLELGILSLDELTTQNTFTYSNILNTGIDVRFDVDRFLVPDDGVRGNLTRGDGSNGTFSLSFFNSFTGNPTNVENLTLLIRDIDLTANPEEEHVGLFNVEYSGGTLELLSTDSDVFVLGTNLSTIDIDGSNTISPDSVTGTVNDPPVSTNDLLVDLTGRSINRIFLQYNGFVGIGGSFEANIVPEPSTVLIAFIGLTTVVGHMRSSHQ